jgi:hypothetical protein
VPPTQYIALLRRSRHSVGVTCCVWALLLTGGCGARSALDLVQLSSETARGGGTASTGGAGSPAGGIEERGGASNGGASNGGMFNGPGGSVAVSGGSGGSSGSANGGESLGGGAGIATGGAAFGGAAGAPTCPLCPIGASCVDGGCQCPGSEIACGTTCVDPSSDTNHCGSCGAACVGTCQEGRCLSRLAATSIGAYGIAVDSKSAYFTAYDDTVSQVPIAGGATTLHASGQQTPEAIAVDATGVYWVNNYLEHAGSAVLELPLPGGTTPFTLATEQAYPGYPDGIAVDKNYVYWTDSFGGDVLALPRKGSSALTIPFAQGQLHPDGIAVDASSVYWINYGDGDPNGAVMKVSLNGGAPTTLASAQFGPQGIALDANNVYWTNNGGTVLKASINGGTVTTLATDQVNPQAIVVDETNVYWTNSFSGVVMTVPVAGGTPTALASNQANCYGIAVDATSLYWTTSVGVMKLTPK